MNNFEYQPIDLSSDAIRLVRLKKGLDTSPIECELVEAYLHAIDGIPYNALSYVWGDGSCPVEVTVDGQTTLIRNNLYTALHCLRSAREDKLLWVDALSIDQANDQEKTHQVGQMRLVYENAESVLIWLGAGGREADDIGLAMELAARLDKKAMRRGSSKAWELEWPILLQQIGGAESKVYQRQCQTFTNLLERPWFRRVWIIQEAASARSATVLCGWHSVPARTFARLPSLMGLSKGPDVTHYQPVLDMMLARNHSRSDARSTTSSIATLLKEFRASEATDPRDKVYALLGIASDARDSSLRPDYGLSETQAVRNTISYL
ncbi:HET-domain-containing protein, partial [Thozetella sp. PMI_491]